MLKTMSSQERLIKSRIELLLEFPFFGQLSLYLKLVEDKNVATAATDGKHYYYNPEFINRLSDKELNFLTVHEVLHPALGHLWRKGNKNNMVFNYAADYVINAMIKECDPSENTFKMIDGALYDKKFDGLSTEEIYDILISQQDQNQDQNNGSGTLDDHSYWEKKDQDGNNKGDQNGGNNGGMNENGEEDWKGRVVQAATVAEGKQKGKIPSMIKRMLKNLTQPQKNWKQLLAEFVEQEISDYGFTPPDRRFSHADILLPDFSEPEDVVKNLVFAVDTSGSIGEREFTVFLSEIIGCMNQFGGKVKGTLIYCDAYIAEDGVYDLEDVTKSLPRGGGGTDFRPVFNWIRDNLDDDCAGLVYLTDGYGSYPDKQPHYPVLWVLTNEYNTPFGINTEIKI